MDNLEIRQTAGSGSDTTILRIQGPLTMATLFDFQSAVRQPDLRSMILDLAEVPYMDSAGLGVILSAWAHTQRTGHKFGLANVGDRVRTLLEITKTSDVLPSYGTVEEAEQSFAAGGGAAAL